MRDAQYTDRVEADQSTPKPVVNSLATVSPAPQPSDQPLDQVDHFVTPSWSSVVRVPPETGGRSRLRRWAAN